MAYLNSEISIMQGVIVFEEPQGVNINLLSDFPNYLHIYKAMDSQMIITHTKRRIMKLYNDFFTKVSWS